MHLTLLFPNSEISDIKGNIIYLGDSENDNPAFRKADISIGVNSDNRLNPTLDCTYTIKFENLSIFLRRLVDNDLISQNHCYISEFSI